MSDNEAKPQEVKKTTMQIFVEEITTSSLTITLLAVVTGLIVGGLLVAITSENVYTAWDESPLLAIQAGFQDAWSMYVAYSGGRLAALPASSLPCRLGMRKKSGGRLTPSWKASFRLHPTSSPG